MNSRLFFEKVAQMREAQKTYFRTRSNSAYNKSRSLESEIDAEISRVQAILESRKPKEQDLFGNI